MMALIRPKKRKAHLATDVGGQWLPLCDQAPATIDGTPFLSIDAAASTVNAADPRVCVYCLRMIALVHILDHLDAVGGGHGLTAVA